MCAGTAATAAAAIGGSVAAAAAGESPADPLAGLRNLRLLDLSVAIEHEAPGELDKPSIKYSDPIPGATAVARESSVHLTILNDADLETGKVVFDFDDPSITIEDVKISDLRHAVISTNSKNLAGNRVFFDVQTRFHRHYGEAVIGE